jgi:hypothetical protein
MRSLFALAIIATLALTNVAEPQQRRDEPYSCRLYRDEQRKCAFNAQCDRRPLERLRNECLRDGGNP